MRAHALKGNSSEQNSFSFMRLALSTIVLAGHAAILSGSRTVLSIGKIPLTAICVFCFFALSGFLVAPGLLRNGVRYYIFRRVSRIYPAYLGVLASVAFGFSWIWQILSPAKNFNICQSLKYIFINILPPPGIFNQESRHINFLSGQPIGVPLSGFSNGSLWSLSLEFMAYVSLAGIFCSTRRDRTLFNKIINIVVMTILFWAIIFSVCYSRLYFKSPTFFEAVFSKWPYLLCFFIGVGLNFWPKHKSSKNVFTLLSLIIFVSASFNILLFAIVGAAALTYLVIQVGESRAFVKIPLKLDISYGIYLYHYPVEQTFAHFRFLRENLILFILLSIIFSSMFAYLSAKFIEVPIQRKAQEWIARDHAQS